MKVSQLFENELPLLADIVMSRLAKGDTIRLHAWTEGSTLPVTGYVDRITVGTEAISFGGLEMFMPLMVRYSYKLNGLSFNTAILKADTFDDDYQITKDYASETAKEWAGDWLLALAPGALKKKQKQVRDWKASR
jgi:hypothetical protein